MPFGVDKPGNLNNRAGRANVSKEFAIHLADLLPVIDIRQVDPGSNVFYRICIQLSRCHKLGLRFRHYRVARLNMSRIRGGDGHNTAWKVGAFGYQPKTHWGKRVCIGVIRAFLRERKPPKRCSLTGLYYRELVERTHKGS